MAVEKSQPYVSRGIFPKISSALPIVRLRIWFQSLLEWRWLQTYGTPLLSFLHPPGLGGKAQRTPFSTVSRQAAVSQQVRTSNPQVLINTFPGHARIMTDESFASSNPPPTSQDNVSKAKLSNKLRPGATNAIQSQRTATFYTFLHLTTHKPAKEPRQLPYSRPALRQNPVISSVRLPLGFNSREKTPCAGNRKSKMTGSPQF